VFIFIMMVFCTMHLANGTDELVSSRQKQLAGSVCDLYMLSKKMCHFYFFFNNSVKHWLILIIFGLQHREET